MLSAGFLSLTKEQRGAFDLGNSGGLRADMKPFLRFMATWFLSAEGLWGQRFGELPLIFALSVIKAK